MNRHRAGLALSMMLLAAAGLVGQAPAARAAPHDVAVADFSFIDAASSSSMTTVSAGESVTWTWSGVAQHSVTADNASFDSDPPSGARTSGTYVLAFGTPGTYAYYCRIHGGPGGNGMAGTIVVQAAAPTGTATSTPAATSTPVTPSVTPNATRTQIATDTPAPGAAPSATPAAVPSSAAPPPGAGTGAATQLPRTGGGEAPGVSAWPALALALLGAMALSGALAARRRAEPHRGDQRALP